MIKAEFIGGVLHSVPLVGLVVIVDNTESIKEFTELVHRATNLWPDAPPQVKVFADYVTNYSWHPEGPLQNYAGQDTSPAASMEKKRMQIPDVHSLMVQDTQPVELKIRDFESQIMAFNQMYKLPIAAYPNTSAVIEDEVNKRPINLGSMTPRGKDYLIQRLAAFKKTLSDEVAEVDDIIRKISTGMYTEHDVDQFYTEIDGLVDIADWLGDIQVFCASEMVKFGIPVNDTLRIIMQSNFSKQNPDGSTTYDDNGKVQKGPNYWKPEPMIRQMLGHKIEEVKKQAASDEKSS